MRKIDVVLVARPSLKKQSTTINNAVAGQQILPFLVFSRCSRAHTGNMIGRTRRKGCSQIRRSAKFQPLRIQRWCCILVCPQEKTRPVTSVPSPPLLLAPFVPSPLPISVHPDRKKCSHPNLITEQCSSTGWAGLVGTWKGHGRVDGQVAPWGRRHGAALCPGPPPDTGSGEVKRNETK